MNILEFARNKTCASHVLFPTISESIRMRRMMRRRRHLSPFQQVYPSVIPRTKASTRLAVSCKML